MTRRSRKNSNSKTQLYDYNTLEQRNLLAVDLGVNVTGATYQTDSLVYPANATSDVGTDHIVEVMNGRVNILQQGHGSTRFAVRPWTAFLSSQVETFRTRLRILMWSMINCPSDGLS